MLLNVVAGAAIVALLSLVIAMVAGTAAFGWAAIACSAFGLLLLSIHELVQRSRTGINAPAAGDDTEEVVQPDIWPPVHPTEEASESDSAEPRADGTLRPDIWP